jgi:Holliday junction resolvasome RuvABC endonuclease subunit
MRHFFCAWDQAFANSGFALLEWVEKEEKLKYVSSNVFHPSIKWGHKSDAIAFLEHQKHIKDTLEQVSSEGSIHAIGIEGVAFSAPGQAASRGGIWALYSVTSVRYGDLVVVSPTRLKKYLTEYGFSDKEDIKKVIEPRYGLTGRNLSPDEYDAIGIAEIAAYAYLIMNGHKDTLKKILSKDQFEVFLDSKIVKDIKTQKTEFKEKKKVSKKKKKKKFKASKLSGICDRPDDFYITKRGT